MGIYVCVGVDMPWHLYRGCCTALGVGLTFMCGEPGYELLEIFLSASHPILSQKHEGIVASLVVSGDLDLGHEACTFTH